MSPASILHQTTEAKALVVSNTFASNTLVYVFVCEQGNSSSGPSDSDPDVASDNSGSGDSDTSSSSGSGSSSSGSMPAAPDNAQVFYPHGFKFGIHAFTKVKGVNGGYQCTCRHPDHTGESASCTKTHSVSPQLGGMEGTLRRLKHWAVQCVNVPTKSAHKALWKEVTTDWNAGTTPSMQELDRQILENTSEKPYPHAPPAVLALADAAVSSSDDEVPPPAPPPQKKRRWSLKQIADTDQQSGQQRSDSSRVVLGPLRVSKFRAAAIVTLCIVEPLLSSARYDLSRTDLRQGSLKQIHVLLCPALLVLLLLPPAP